MNQLERAERGMNAPAEPARHGHGPFTLRPDHRLYLAGGSGQDVRDKARAIIKASARALPWRPMPPLPWTKQGIRLYIFECSGFHKIGISEDPARRLLDLQPGCPLAISQVFTSGRLASPYAKWAESLAHHALAEFKERSEWFRIDAPYAIPIVQAAHWMAKEERARDGVRFMR